VTFEMSAPATTERRFTDEEICKIAALNLYRNGSDSRQQKNGNPDGLVSDCLKSIAAVTTIGVYKHYLSFEERKLISDNSDKKGSLDLEFISRMCKVVLRAMKDISEYKNERDIKCYVHIPTVKQLQMLEQIAAGNYNLYKIKEINCVLSPRKMFIYQERQKVDH